MKILNCLRIREWLLLVLSVAAVVWSLLVPLAVSNYPEVSTESGWLRPVSAVILLAFGSLGVLRLLWMVTSRKRIVDWFIPSYTIGCVFGLYLAISTLNAHFGLLVQSSVTAGAFLLIVLYHSKEFFVNCFRITLIGSPIILAFFSCIFIAPTPDLPMRVLQNNGGYAPAPLESMIGILMIPVVLALTVFIAKEDDFKKVPFVSTLTFLVLNVVVACVFALTSLALGDWHEPTASRFIGFAVLYSIVLATLALAWKRLRSLGHRGGTVFV